MLYVLRCGGGQRGAHHIAANKVAIRELAENDEREC